MWRMDRIVISRLLDPFVNLALENVLFDALSNKARLLFLYTNSPCVVIGRNQNPWKETNIQACATHNVPILRRRSGGGTVVHDLGNVNFCVATPRSEFSRTKHIDLLVQSLADYGLKTNERHDIVNKDNQKVSGSSYKIIRDKAYHHATMLLNSDLDKLKALLKKDPEAGTISGLGTDSISSPVANASIDAEVYQNHWLELFWNEYDVEQIDVVTDVPDSVKEEAEILRSWDWRFGQTPKFSHKIGPYELQIEKGIVTSGPDALVGQRYGQGTDLGEYSEYVNIPID